MDPGTEALDMARIMVVLAIRITDMVSAASMADLPTPITDMAGVATMDGAVDMAAGTEVGVAMVGMEAVGVAAVCEAALAAGDANQPK